MARTGPGTPSFAVHDVCVNWLIRFCGSSALAGIVNTMPIRRIIRRAQRGFGATKPRAAGRARPPDRLPAGKGHLRIEPTFNVGLHNKQKLLHPADESLTVVIVERRSTF